MRAILTIFAVALVALMTAALVAPYLIDWSAYRAEIAGRLEAFLGGRVTLTGPVTLRLLPAPYLEVGAGKAEGAGPGAPTLAFKGARLELALVKLASGGLRFTEVRLEKPVVTLARGAGGALRLPAAASASAAAVGFDRFAISDGTIRIVDASGAPEWTIEGVDLAGDAPSLAGPYHVSGRASGPQGAPIIFRLASERAGAAGAPVRVAVEAGATWPALEFDGTVVVAGPKGPTATGTVALGGTAVGLDGPTPWRAAGRLAADLDGARLSGAEFRFGPEERALRAEGSAGFDWRGGARLAIDAKAKQANVDALLRRNGEDGVAPARAVAALAAALDPALAAAGSTELDARLAVETALLGGDALSGLVATLQARPGKPLTTRFELGLPGRSRLAGEGAVETGAAARYLGTIDFATEDFSALAGWAGQGSPELGAVAAPLADALPSRRLAVSGAIEAAAVGFAGKALTIGLGDSTLTGALAVTRRVGADPGRVYADLSADSLDVEALPSLDAARSLVGDADLSLTLDVRALKVAHLGQAGIDGAALRLSLGKTGSRLSLDRLAIDGLGGASVEATGAAGPDGSTARGRLEAARLTDLASLVSRLAPGAWSRALVAEAPRLAPASIAFTAEGGPLADGAPPLKRLTLNGTLAGTQVALGAAPSAKGGGQNFTLTLDSPDSEALVRQLGLAAAATPGGPGRIVVDGSGAWESGYDLDASAALASAALSGRGRFQPTAEGDAARLFGSVKLEAANLAPFAALFGLAPAGGAIGPVAATADATLRGDRWTVSRLAATVAGVRATGSLVYDLGTATREAIVSPDLARAEEAVNGPAAGQAPAPAAVTGELTIDRLGLADLAALALGPPHPAAPGKLWSDATFAPRPLTLPSAAVRVHVGAMPIVGGLVGEGFSTDLRLDEGRLDLDALAMRIGGAAVAGRATIRRSGETATLDGAVAIAPALLNRPGFSGRVGVRLDFASTGKSAAALIGGLAGEGAAEFSGAALARNDPAALERAVAAAQESDAQIDETNVAYRLAAALDKGPLPIPDGSAPLALSGGTLKLGPIAIPRPNGAATLAGSFDMSRMAAEARLTLTAPAEGLKFWSGPAPSATVTIEDALEAPKRRLDVAGLAAGLATQAIARESDRIASLEADIRERAFFNRRLKGERFLDRREAEIEDWRAEQERLKGLAQRLAEQKAEEERQAAEEKAAEEKAAAEKAAADKAAGEKAAAEKAAAEKADVGPAAAGPPRAPVSAAGRDGADAIGTPSPPARPRPPGPPERSNKTEELTPGSLY